MPFSSRPKFLYTLIIADIHNIPKPSGSCYVQWRILNTLPSIRGRTSTAHIKDYKAVWKYAEEGIVKLSTKATQLQPKWIELEVYIVTKHHQTSKSGEELGSSREKSFLGKVHINLAEFAGLDGTQTMRYLLKDSRVNAVLNVEIGMTLVKGDINDYIVPPMRSKGLTNVFGDSMYESSSMGSRHGAASASSPSEQRFHKSSKIASDPIITKMYQKTFEISWDPRPGEFTADECVDDIMNGGDGWAKNQEGVDFIDLQMETYKQAEAEEENKATMLKEARIRQDMKSWHVQHLFH
jgi:hypothetical protein